MTKLKVDPTKTFFTSDLHHSHANILKFCNRPYKDVEEMNENLIVRWNAKIPVDGVVFVLGDVSFDKNAGKIQNWVRRLNGEKHLVRGNHDDHIEDSIWIDAGFASVSSLKDIYVGKKPVVLCHFPMKSWNGSHRGSWQLYGHMHGSMPDPTDSYQMDVGVDTNGMNPYSWDEIVARMETKKVTLIPKGKND